MTLLLLADARDVLAGVARAAGHLGLGDAGRDRHDDQPMQEPALLVELLLGPSERLRGRLKGDQVPVHRFVHRGQCGTGPGEIQGSDPCSLPRVAPAT